MGLRKVLKRKMLLRLLHNQHLDGFAAWHEFKANGARAWFNIIPIVIFAGQFCSQCKLISKPLVRPVRSMTGTFAYNSKVRPGNPMACFLLENGRGPSSQNLISQ